MIAPRRPLPAAPTLALAAALGLTAGCGPARWVWGVHGVLSAAPVRVGDRVFVAQDQFGVRFPVTALDWDTGDAVWTQLDAGWEPCDQLLADGDGLFAVCGPVISALDPASGRLLWRTELPAPPAAPVILGDEGLLVRVAPPGEVDPATVTLGPGHGGPIRADGAVEHGAAAGEHPAAQALVWRWMAGYPPAYAWAFMAMDDVVGTTDLPEELAPPTPVPGAAPLPWGPSTEGAAPWALAPETQRSPREGMALWDPAPPAPTDPDPDGTHLALILDRDTGEETLRVRGSARGPLAFTGSLLVWGAPGRVVAVDAVHGVKRWDHLTGLSPGGEGQLSLLTGGGAVYLLLPGRLEVLDAWDGAPRWSADTEGRASPVLTPQAVLLVEGGRLKALSEEDGGLRWTAPAPGVVDPPLVHEDRAFLVTVNGDISALDLQDGHLLWRAHAEVDGQPFLVGDRMLWVSGDALTALAPDGASTQALRLPRPGLDPRWRPPDGLEALAPVVRDEDVLLRVDPDRVALLRL